MSTRITRVILMAAVSMAFGLPLANAQQPQPPQSLRIWDSSSGSVWRLTPGGLPGAIAVSSPDSIPFSQVFSVRYLFQ